jgi:hypothetical protein
MEKIIFLLFGAKRKGADIIEGSEVIRHLTLPVRRGFHKRDEETVIFGGGTWYSDFIIK